MGSTLRFVRSTVLLSTVLLGATNVGIGCAGGKAAATNPVAVTPKAPPPPPGPTRTDFKTIAKELVSRCVAGGWISRWRAEQPDVDAAKPKIHLVGFEDRTEQNLDPTYLQSTLEQRMRLSGVYEMVADGAAAHFLGRGKLLRLAERGRNGQRFSVYTATLDLLEPATGRVAYSCEATVRGEM